MPLRNNVYQIHFNILNCTTSVTTTKSYIISLQCYQSPKVKKEEQRRIKLLNYEWEIYDEK